MTENPDLPPPGVPISWTGGRPGHVVAASLTVEVVREAIESIRDAPVYHHGTRERPHILSPHVGTYWRDHCIECGVHLPRSAPEPVDTIEVSQLPSLPETVLNATTPNCEVCLGEGWVCEDHPTRPFSTGSTSDCDCGAAGRPCVCTGLE